MKAARTIAPATYVVCPIVDDDLRRMVTGGDDEEAYPPRVLHELGGSATEYVEKRVGALIADRRGIEDMYGSWGRPGNPRERLELSARPLPARRIDASNITNLEVRYLDGDGDTRTLAGSLWRMVWTGDYPGVWIAQDVPEPYPIEPLPVTVKYDWRSPAPLPDAVREAVGLVFRAFAASRTAGEPLDAEALDGVAGLLAGWRRSGAAFV